MKEKNKHSFETNECCTWSLAVRWIPSVAPGLLIVLLFPLVLAAAEVPLDTFLLRKTKIGSDFTLTDHNGGNLSLEQFRGKVVLLAFGFTHCPDVCPTTVSKMAMVLNRLGNKAESARGLFISVDPERDTPEILKKYVSYFHKDIVGLTGSLEDLENVAYEFMAPFKKIESESAIGYLMAHSTSFYLIDPQGKVKYVLPHRTSPKILVKGINKLLN